MEKEIDGLDINKAISRFGGNKELYLKVLRAYMVSMRKLLTSITTVDENDIHSYEVTVHGIKGSSLNVCADLVGNLAKDLENAAKANDRVFIADNNLPFLEAAQKLIDDLDDLFALHDLEMLKPKKDKPDEAALARLLTACDICDLDEVDVVMEEISGYTYESDDGLADWLRVNVEQMSFSEIVRKLSGI